MTCTASTLPFNERQKDAFNVLHSSLMGGGIDRKTLMVELFTKPGKKCTCADCKKSLPKFSRKFKLNSQSPEQALALAIAKELRPELDIIQNARGVDRDPRQIVADLVSDGRSPFGPDDAESLRSMSTATLLAMRDRYLGDEEDPAIKAMTAHLTVRNKVPTVQDLNGVRRDEESPYTPEDEAIAKGKDADALVARSHRFHLEQSRRIAQGQALNRLMGHDQLFMPKSPVDDFDIEDHQAEIRAQVRGSKVRKA